MAIETARKVTPEEHRWMRDAVHPVVSEAYGRLRAIYGSNDWENAPDGVKAQVVIMTLTQEICMPAHHGADFNVLHVASACGATLGAITNHLPDEQTISVVNVFLQAFDNARQSIQEVGI